MEGIVPIHEFFDPTNIARIVGQIDGQFRSDQAPHVKIDSTNFTYGALGLGSAANSSQWNISVNSRRARLIRW